MNRGLTRHRLAMSFAALLLAGCSVGPDYRWPDFDLPHAWRAAPASEPASARPADRVGERWWTLYADPVLDRLIDEALKRRAGGAA